MSAFQEYEIIGGPWDGLFVPCPADIEEGSELKFTRDDDPQARVRIFIRRGRELVYVEER